MQDEHNETQSGVVADTILIVGDWVVDEYWFLVKHYSEISSHTGYNHYRLSSQPTEIVADLCGAGHIARVLYHLQGKSSSPNKIIGLGNWNEKDTELIKHFVHSRDKKDCHAASAWFRLTPRCCAEPPDISLIPLRPRSATNRVIRQYHQEKGRVRQINRVDWEPERSLSKEGLEPIDFDNLGMPRPDEISAILIHDLVKGVVTKDLIVVLKERYPKARWYVRSKLKTPRWLTLIRDSIELLVIGPEVAALHNPWETWLAYGQMTIQALEIIEKLPGKNVVLLSDQREVIARLSEQCVTAKSMIEPSPPAQLGWTSAFFASLAHSMCHKKADTMPEDISWAIESADELGGIPLPASCETPSVEKRQPNIRPGLWAKEANDWQQARQGCGIIKADNGEMTLEVWRGSSHLPGYIACIKRKEEIIIGIGQNLRAFNEGGSQIRSLSIMLQADPGAGKTVLAKSLADAFNFSFVRFDITQMIHRDELLDLFDTLATMQANEDKKILVFVDEINALLDNSHVYGAFLAPLEESVFARRGKSFSLKPCVWVFAGTKLDEAGVASREKLSDFKSRMTIIENIDFKSLALTTKDTERLQNEARLEQVYLGAAMIGRHFPDVQKVTKEILDHFHKLDPAEAPARAIRKLAGSLRNVQYGSVSRANCESWDIEWEDSKEGETPVKLYFG